MGLCEDLSSPEPPTCCLHQNRLSCKWVLPLSSEVLPMEHTNRCNMVMVTNEIKRLTSRGQNAGAERVLEVHKIQRPLSVAQKRRDLSKGPTASKRAYWP